MYRGALIENQFEKPSHGVKWINENPYDLQNPLFEWHENPDFVEPAVSAAKTAFYEWRSLPEKDKLAWFERLKQVFQDHTPQFTEAIIRESGKAEWEAAAEAKALSAKIDITINDALPLMREIEKTGYVEHKSGLRFRPRGVVAVIGPFNFPLHLSNGHIIPALLTGNTVILKPSEHCPLTASLYASCFLEAGFPKAVFQMLPGGAETGRRLVEHPDVRGIFFTGSYQNGKRIQQSLLDTRDDMATALALEMGGKNASIVHEDADLKNAVAETVLSAFATTGQRCSCSSRILVHKKIYQEFKNAFVAATKNLNIGDPALKTTFMGPMIHEQALSSFLSKLDAAKKEGYLPLLDSERPSESNCLVTPSVFEIEAPPEANDTLFVEEAFGPNTVITSYESPDEAVELHERAPYGLVASVFTGDPKFLKAMDEGLEVGLLNWNRGSVGANSKLPFGGVKRSGNNWPAGIFSFLYCVSPRSYLEEKNCFSADRLPPPLRLALNFE